ncbi:hypothetical protein RJ639_017351 [Escallonia herrerae]|uniref:DUF4283 domain-containing protein n=1 Tax=Escallonia herrerae TaxID=1293975 RepID=A0AA88VCT1_9ASTE|nr:hypothetical protein RJ639_017351 [Escallonia herrerae]
MAKFKFKIANSEVVICDRNVSSEREFQKVRSFKMKLSKFETGAQLNCEETIDLEEDDSNANREYFLTFLAKIISSKKSNLKAVQSILSKAWNPTKGMKITPLADNTICITFNHEWDRMRILESRPWSIMSSSLVIRDWSPNLYIKEIELNYTPFWVRICRLPPNQMTKPNAEKIAKKR